ncbi:MAG: carboxypeptidase-like regulatory domain-containing protein, partial [Terracidiphilus sp.]
METQKQFRIAGSLFPVLCLLVFLFLPSRLTAQLDRGEITGTVEDPSGAVVQNARVVLTNDATSVSATTNSTQTGTYVFNNLLPGEYTVEAEAGGFQKYVVHGVYVHVQQVLTVDVHFATGNVEQSVSVTAAAP